MKEQKSQDNICYQCEHGLCISKVSIFQQLSTLELVEILKKVHHIQVKKGDTLVQEGEQSSTLYIINTGIVKLSRSNSLGKEQIIALQTDGDIIGEYYLLSDYEPYHFSVIALSDVRICSLSKKDMDAILDDHPNLCRTMLTELSRKMIEIENKLQNISITETDSKVAFLLLQLYEKFGYESADGYRIDNPLSREDMANFAGMTRETMSRYLSRLSKEGIIDISDKNKIQLLKKEELNLMII
ncbi:MAG: Crp/Fnr family transcriptional regulator [Lachnospiraceae bacterium]